MAKSLTECKKEESLIECKKKEMEQMIKIPVKFDEDPPPPVKPDTTDIETPQGPPIKPNLEDTPTGSSPEPQPQRQPQTHQKQSDQPLRPQQRNQNISDQSQRSPVPYNNNNDDGYRSSNNNNNNMRHQPITSRQRIRQMYTKNYERSQSIYAHLPIKTKNPCYYQHNIACTRPHPVEDAVLQSIGWENTEYPIGWIPSDVTFYLFILFHNAYSQLNIFSKKYLYII